MEEEHVDSYGDGKFIFVYRRTAQGMKRCV